MKMFPRQLQKAGFQVVYPFALLSSLLCACLVDGQVVCTIKVGGVMCQNLMIKIGAATWCIQWKSISHYLVGI